MGRSVSLGRIGGNTRIRSRLDLRMAAARRVRRLLPLRPRPGMVAGFQCLPHRNDLRRTPPLPAIRLFPDLGGAAGFKTPSGRTDAGAANRAGPPRPAHYHLRPSLERPRALLRSFARRPAQVGAVAPSP